MTTKILKSMIVIMTALFSTIVMAQTEKFSEPRASDSDILIIQVNKKPTFTIEVDSTKNTEATVSSSNFFKLYCAKEVELTAPVTLTASFSPFELDDGTDTYIEATWTLPKGKIVKNQKINGKITLPKEISAGNPSWFKRKISFRSTVEITGDEEGVQALTKVLFDDSDFLGNIEMKISKSSFEKQKIPTVKEQSVFFSGKEENYIAVPKKDKKMTATLQLTQPASKEVTFDVTSEGSAVIDFTDKQIKIAKGKKSAKFEFTIVADSAKKLDLFNTGAGFEITAIVTKADSDIFTPAELYGARIDYGFKDQQSKYIKGTMTALVATGAVDVKKSLPLHTADTLLLTFAFDTTKSSVITKDSINKNQKFDMEIKFNGPVKTVFELGEVFEFSQEINPVYNSKGRELNGVFVFTIDTDVDTTLELTVKDPTKMGKYTFSLVSGYTNTSDVKFKASGKTTITVEPIKEIQVATASAATTLTFVNSGKYEEDEDVSGYARGVDVDNSTDDLTMETTDNNGTGVVTVITDKKVLKGYIGEPIVEGVKTVVGPKEFNLKNFTKAPAFFSMAYDPIKDKLEYGKSKKYASKATFTKTSDSVTVIAGKGPKAYNPSVLSKARKAGFFFTSIVDSKGVLPSVKDQAKATTKEIVYNYNQLVGAPLYIAIKEGKDGKAGYINISEKDAINDAPVGVCVYTTPTIDTVKIDSAIVFDTFAETQADTVKVTTFDSKKITIDGSNFIGSKAKIIIEYKTSKGNAVIAKTVKADKDSTDKKLVATLPVLGKDVVKTKIVIIIDNGSTLTPIKKQIIVE